MSPKQTEAFTRLAVALQQAREALADAMRESAEALRVADDAYEAAQSIKDLLETISDDARPDHSSGLLAEFHDSVYSTQRALDRLTEAVETVEPKDEPMPAILSFGFPPVNP